ncbi:GNAT family N-acetyltransferase [Flavobacterium sp. Sd200]|uniref:GNAT family N-acetyltransferase n=1 Tax=Flavobacterium sp. Sd200 TaxID=2692211 RepID=UPI00136C3542|nr:GNAT family N-acetyltransferase [Flavobacterium sp. Sd200]MXN90545.1 GNAT family N-acetyltransferase [Flavobacterium sp. Sd200]
MADIKLELNEKNHGAFNLYEDNAKIGEMVISIKNDELTVYHTGVDESASGKGYAKLLLDAMVAHVRQNNMKVIPLCPYVHAQFKKHPEEYSDIWLKQNENE